MRKTNDESCDRLFSRDAERSADLRAPLRVAAKQLARPGLLVFLAVLLGLCTLLTWWSVRSGRVNTPTGRPDDSGFDLRADDSSSNLNSTSAEAPAGPLAPPPLSTLDRLATDVEEGTSSDRSQPAPVQVSQPENPGTLPPAAAPMGPSLPPLPELPALPAIQESNQAPPLPPLPQPVVPVPPPSPSTGEGADPALVELDCIRKPHRGDTPMMRHWKMLGLPALLAAALTAAPVVADNTDKQKTDSERLVEIQNQLKSMQNSLAQVEAVKKELQDIRTTMLSVQKLQDTVNQLRDDMAKMQREMETLRTQMSTSNRIALSPPNPPATGRIQLVNQYPGQVTIILNNRAVYRLAPGERQMVDAQPAGSFTFEVLTPGGNRPPVTRPLSPNETYTITVFAQ